jgi:serine/threonine-protein kinase RsbW
MAMADFPTSVLDDGTTVRLLRPDEGGLVGEAIRAAYGDSYDAAWVYDAQEVGRRLADGRFTSAVAETAAGELLCHAGLTRPSAADRVAEAGQAVTLPAARGHHLFTRVKAYLRDWAAAEGLYGLFSEVTTAHPYSEKANVDLGAKEAGFLLGWIPETVENDAAAAARHRGRQAVALFYLKANTGHERPLHAPAHHREVVTDIVRECDLAGVVQDAPVHGVASRSEIHVQVREDHGWAVLTVEVPGADLGEVVERERARLLEAQGLAVLYVDLPLARPETESVGSTLEHHQLSFAGVFPNARVDGDVLRLQCLHQVDVSADDISTASDHGRDLLAYVLADLQRVT